MAIDYKSKYNDAVGNLYRAAWEMAHGNIEVASLLVHKALPLLPKSNQINLTNSLTKQKYGHVVLAEKILDEYELLKPAMHHD